MTLIGASDVIRLTLTFIIMAAGFLKLATKSSPSTLFPTPAFLITYDRMIRRSTHAAHIILEVVLATWLVSGWLPGVALLFTAGSFLVFGSVATVVGFVDANSDCGCFGAISNGEPHWWIVLRAGSLAVGAAAGGALLVGRLTPTLDWEPQSVITGLALGFAFVFGSTLVPRAIVFHKTAGFIPAIRSSVMSATTILAINMAAAWVVLAILSVAVLAVYHHFGVMYSNSREGRESQGPTIGSDFQLGRLTTVEGQEIFTPAPGRRTAIVFASTYCSICAAVFDQWNAVPDRNQTPYDVVVLCAGDGLTSVRSWAASAPNGFSVILDSRRKRSAAAGVSTTPFLVLVDENGNVFEKGVLSSGEQLVRALTPPRDDVEPGRMRTERSGAMA